MSGTTVMSPEFWQRIQEVVESALELGPCEREAFLERACTGDDALRKEVDSLLAVDDEAGIFLEKTALEVSNFDLPVARADSVVGKRLGPYKAVRQIGRGGMGTVYLAIREDDQYSKEVAIKIIKLGMDTDFILQRFRSERQILANLNHPNIAQLLDGGTTEDGLPYLVMEYVEGKPITQFCDEQKLTTDERLKLFRSVCAAVHYAHQNRVIHRDIKPNNILVTAGGDPKLLDFGIAKLVVPEASTQSVDQTATLMRLMTPEYASPEQIKGEPVRAASDVHSLGVLLYELLTGHRPYHLNNLAPQEIFKAICEEQPDKPSTAISRIKAQTDGATSRTLTPESVSKTRDGQPDKLRRKLKGDIDNIVLMAMRKEPRRRYESAEQLSEDIRRHLQSLPVIARKDTFAYRSAKFIGRNKTSVVTGSAVALLALLIGVSLSDFNGRVNAVQSVAVVPFINASGDSGADYLSDGITDNLKDGLSHLPGLRVVSHRSMPSDIRQEPNLESIGRDLKVEVVLSGKVIQQGDNLSVRAELFDVTKNRYIWSKQYSRSLSGILSLQIEILREVAEGLRLKISGQEETLRRRRYTDNTEAYQAYLKGRYLWTKRTEESLSKSIECFKQAIQKDPAYALAYAGMADSYIILGFIQRPGDAFPKAEENALKALQLDDSLSEAHTSLARVKQLFEQDWITTENEYHRAIELDPNYATAHLWYADYLLVSRRANEALSEMTLALQLDPLSLIVNANVGQYLYFAHQYDRAIDQCQKTLEIDSRLAAPHFLLGQSYEQKKMYGEAIEEYQKGISFGSGPPALGALGRAYAESGNKMEGQRILERLVASSKDRYVPAYAIAEVYVGLGDKDQAFKWLKRGIEEHCPWMQNLLLAADFDSLRSDPRFTSLLQRMNLIP
jgi:serine/threonine protein kinase/Tfp pilus assembly protein PilF